MRARTDPGRPEAESRRPSYDQTPCSSQGRLSNPSEENDERVSDRSDSNESSCDSKRAPTFRAQEVRCEICHSEFDASSRLEMTIPTS